MSYRKLPDAEKQRLRECFERGFSAPRIAQLMGLPVATVKRWRAKWQARQIMPCSLRPAPLPRLEVAEVAPKPACIASSFIEPIPLARLMAGR